MNFVIFDLEFNGAYSKRKYKYINEIIEIGAVKCDPQLNIIDTFSMLVTPQIGKRLNRYVKQLTHITPEELFSSHNMFTHVLSKFRKFVGDDVLMTWGRSDVLVLMENIEYYQGKKRIDFAKYYCNVQRYCEDEMGIVDKTQQIGLASCASRLGVEFDSERLHRACDDAILTAQCLKAVCNFQTLPRYIEEINDRFYEKINFKNYFIYDYQNPLIDKREMYFLCDVCGHKTRRKTRWNVKNKSFRAEFRCTRCDRDFEGRISFKKTFEGVVVNKKIHTLKEKEEEGQPRQENDDEAEN